MSDLGDLLREVSRCDESSDLDGLRQVRDQIVAEFPDSDEAVEALYKIGLDQLFRERNLAAAVGSFAEAAKRKHPFWSLAARTSLGLCYYHQGRSQKALFELRKVAYGDPPGPHSVSALMFIESILADEGNVDEARRVRKVRIQQLEKLIPVAAAVDPAELGVYLHSLAVAYRDHGNEARATELLERAKALGADVLGADLYRSVLEAL